MEKIQRKNDKFPEKEKKKNAQKGLEFDITFLQIFLQREKER